MTDTGNAKLIKDEMSDRIVETAEEIAVTDGTGKLTVRRILKALGITNRVFYNRFHNIGEVLEVVYKNTVLKVRECIISRVDAKKDFFEQVSDLVTDVLLMSYDTRMQMSGFVFESGSNEDGNREWWMKEIKKIIDHAMEKNYIKQVDSEVLSYSIWCFCRGYNADVVARNISREKAAENFRYSFSFILEGLKK